MDKAIETGSVSSRFDYQLLKTLVSVYIHIYILHGSGLLKP